MTKSILGISSLVLGFVCVSSAWAADICEAIALRDVHAIEDSSSILKRGEHDTAITQYNVDKKTGVKSFCSHGGFCYPAFSTVNSKEVEALHLTNCRIDQNSRHEDQWEISYELTPIRTRIPSAALKRDDLVNRLLDLGICTACASNAADFYIDKPSSRCGQLVKRAIEGNPVATSQLKENFPDYCWE